MGAFGGFAVTFGNVINSLPFGRGLFRPPNWGNQPQPYSMTCTLPAPVPTDTAGVISSTPQPATQSPQPITYYFDAVMRVDHNQELICTEHPVQVGPAVVDHAYLRPARVVVDVIMSDAADSFISGQYSSDISKSVSAYRLFKQIQAARVPITLATRLDTYYNLVIEDVRGTEDQKTSRGFRGTLYFRQIQSASVSTVKVSARPDTTGATNEGIKSAEPVPLPVANGISTFPRP